MEKEQKAVMLTRRSRLQVAGVRLDDGPQQSSTRTVVKDAFTTRLALNGSQCVLTYQ